MPEPTLLFCRGAMREVDRRCIEEFGIPGVVLMENAAGALADRALNIIQRRNCAAARILAGPGANGGDGFALARKLHNAQIPVAIALLADPARITGDARTNLDIARRMRIPIERIAADSIADQLTSVARSAGDNPLIVDALLGTGLTADLRGDIARAVRWINDQPAPVLAVDLPTGLDCDTGKPLGDAVRADATVTFVGWKTGFLAPGADQYTGEITTGDIGAPIELVRELGTPAP